MNKGLKKFLLLTLAVVIIVGGGLAYKYYGIYRDITSEPFDENTGLDSEGNEILDNPFDDIETEDGNTNVTDNQNASDDPNTEPGEEAAGVEGESQEQTPGETEEQVQGETEEQTPGEIGDSAGNKPGTETKPETGTKPGTEAKPETGTTAKPGTGEKPVTGTKPGTGTKPATGTKPQGQTGEKPQGSTKPQPGKDNTAKKETYAQVVQSYKPRFESLESKQESQLNGLIGEGKADYIAAKQNGTSIFKLGAKYLKKANGLEKTADSEFKSLNNEFKAELKSKSYDTSITDQMQTYYNQRKSILRAGVMQQVQGK